MRAPDELTADEVASLRILWSIYPDAIFWRRERDLGWIEKLVEAGYVEATDHPDGVADRLAPVYADRLAPVHAAGLARVISENAEEASRN